MWLQLSAVTSANKVAKVLWKESPATLCGEAHAVWVRHDPAIRR
jgi:hypothetical protein